MRVHSVIVIASLLPATLVAQRRPIPGVSRPPILEPAPLPKQPEPIARAVYYQRRRLSIESYPMLGLMQTSSSSSALTTTWATIGGGVRGDYRVTPLFSTTIDLTSSLAGGPVSVQTAELGTRIRAEHSDRPWDPFFDVRAAYFSTTNNAFGLGFGSSTSTSPLMYSHGWGGVVGAGVEYGLTRTFALTSELLATHGTLAGHDLQGATITNPSFSLSALRFTLGIKYNPVRTLYR